ncbi:MAG: hypothetical protein PHC75_04900 [Burkholderiales bacterium]|nr:hypothetical protein [Burkholderiales bacterium]
MFKKTLLILLAGSSISAFAHDNASAPANSTDNAAFSQNNATEAKNSNSPNVNSRLYSGAQFPQQNDLTGSKGAKYNQQKPEHQNNSDKSSFSRNNATDANQANSPTVNPRLYSGAQFPQQNQLTGEKGVKYNKKPTNQNNSHKSTFNKNNATDANQANSPTVNSRLYSGAQFPQQNQLTGKKKPNKKQNSSQAK